MFFTHLSPAGRDRVRDGDRADSGPRHLPDSRFRLSRSRSGDQPARPALLEAFDAEGKLVDRASLESLPARKSPSDPTPVFTLTVKANGIAYVQFSGPRDGEYLVTDELRFTPVQ